MLAGVQGATAPTDNGWRVGSTVVVDVLAHTDDSSSVDRVRDVAHGFGPGVRAGGIVAQNSDFISAVYGSFPLMIALIALVTFLLLARAFRSVRLPLKAVLLNVVSVAAACGVLTLVWQHGYGSNAIWGIPAAGSIPSWLPVIVFAFLFGLSMDYEVFILSRMRKEYDATGSTETAVVRGIGRTGRLVTSAALILFLGFVAMSSAPSTQVKMIATGIGAGIISTPRSSARCSCLPASRCSDGGTGGCRTHSPASCASPRRVRHSAIPGAREPDTGRHDEHRNDTARVWATPSA